MRFLTKCRDSILLASIVCVIGSAEVWAGEIIKSHMFDLQYTQIMDMKKKKRGGGIGHTKDELIIVAGDGMVRIVDLENDKISKSAIELPANNEADALKAVSTELAEDRVEQAVIGIKNWLRYDDVLVFEDSGKRNIVLSYQHFDPAKSCFTHKLSSLSTPLTQTLRDTKATAEAWKPIYTSQPCFGLRAVRHAYAGHQSGGRIDVLDAEKGDIVLALGDYEHDGDTVPDFPQDMNTDYGKVWKINLISGDAEIISIGLRSSQGITVTQEGAIFTTEHGPYGGDELNLIKAGRNFGWPKVTHGINYKRRPWTQNKSQGRHDGFDYPVISWVPSIATSNVDQSVGFHPYWEEDLLVFTLATQSMHRLRIHDERVVVDEPIEFKDRIRYGLNHEATGNIFLWTDRGHLFKVWPADSAWRTLEKGEGEAYPRYIEDKTPEPSTPDALRTCAECHSGNTKAAPDIRGILGKPIANGPYEGYSDALSKKGGVWTRQSLKEFLQAPQKFANGTNMPTLGLSSEKEIDLIIDSLSSP